MIKRLWKCVLCGKLYLNHTWYVHHYRGCGEDEPMRKVQ
jgi:hypothetical protein